MAAALLQEISQDEHEKARARSRKMYEMDLYTSMETARFKGELLAQEKWQGVVKDKDIEIEMLRSRINELEAKLTNR